MKTKDAFVLIKCQSQNSKEKSNQTQTDLSFYKCFVSLRYQQYATIYSYNYPCNRTKIILTYRKICTGTEFCFIDLVAFSAGALHLEWCVLCIVLHI